MATTSVTNAQQQAQQQAAQNAAARANLLATSLRYTKTSPAVVTTGGGLVNIKLVNVGLLTSVDLLFTITVNNAGAAAATPTVGFPYNLIRNIQFKDYNGTYRVNTTGRHLANLQSIRHGKPWQVAFTPAQGNYTGSQIAYPTSAATTIAGSSSETVNFWLRVPLAYDPKSNLQGMVYMQATLGECYINITPEFNFQNTYDSPFTGATNAQSITITNWSVTMTQNYLQPQIYTNQTVPFMDIQTVYEINQYTTSSNITPNQQVFINYPNSRNVLAMYSIYGNGSAYTYGTDMISFVTQLSANTTIRDDSPTLKFQKLREHLKMDAHPGLYYSDHREIPISTSMFGQMQDVAIPSVVNANAYFDIQTESFYTVGLTLPGLTS